MTSILCPRVFPHQCENLMFTTPLAAAVHEVKVMITTK